MNEQETQEYAALVKSRRLYEKRTAPARREYKAARRAAKTLSKKARNDAYQRAWEAFKAKTAPILQGMYEAAKLAQ